MENGPSRREFDELRAEVRRIDEHGSRELIGVRAQITDIRDDVANLNSKAARASELARIDREQRLLARTADLLRLEKAVANLTRAFWSLVVIVLTTTIGIIATLLAAGSGP